MTSVSLHALSRDPSEGEKLHCNFCILRDFSYSFGLNADPPPGFPLNWATQFSSIRSGIAVHLL